MAGIRDALESGVESAFNAIPSLLEQATLTAKTVDGYDWGAADEPTGAVAPPVIIPVLIYDVRREDSSVEKRGLVKAKDFPGSMYNTLELSSGRKLKVVDLKVSIVVVELTLEEFST